MKSTDLAKGSGPCQILPLGTVTCYFSQSARRQQGSRWAGRCAVCLHQPSRPLGGNSPTKNAESIRPGSWKLHCPAAPGRKRVSEPRERNPGGNLAPEGLKARAPQLPSGRAWGTWTWGSGHSHMGSGAPGGR